MDRFWRSVAVGGNDECWPWRRSTFRFGHGRFSLRERTKQAHRAAWILTKGDIPPSTCVLHSCDNPSCCNPAHLFLGTQGDNMKDRDAKERTAKGERNGRAKLTTESVRAIRMLSKKESQEVIASSYGVAQETISKLLSGK